MSRIVLMIDGNERITAGVISKISNLSGKGLMDVKRAIASHAPVLDRPLFDRLDSSLARDILALLNDLETSDITYKAYELSGKEVYDERTTYFELNSRKLSNMIEARDKSIEQQRVIGRLEDPE